MAKNTPSKQEVRGRRKTTSFSVVSNPIIDNKEITPAAGWLYVLIQRWVTFNAEDFVCSKNFLASKYQSGYRMFNRAWDELKEAGYLKMYSHPTEGWEFELLDEAQPETPHTYYLDLNGEVKSTNVDRAAKKAAKEAEKKKTDHYPQNDTNGNHYPQNDSNGNDSNGNEGNIINTSLNNSLNTFINNQSINHIEEEPKIIPSQPKKKILDRLIDKDLIDDIKDQINYDNLIQRNYDKELLDNCVMCLAELYTAAEPQTINGRTYDVNFVHRRSIEIEYEHIEYVLDCFNKQTEKIYNVRKYLLTAIFNAPDTIGTYYANLVRADGAISVG